MTATPIGVACSLPGIDELQSTEVSASVNLIGQAPFPLAETFNLHSNPNATKTIYLDFNGHLTSGTDWNTGFNLPEIVTPTFDFDGDLTSFSADEQFLIQRIWERVAEDFRPFDVNVTTADPGVANLINTFATDGVDDRWGVRAVIGGDSTFDWFTPADPDNRVVGGVAFLDSFNNETDEPAFVFGYGAGPNSIGIASVVSHEVGHTLGLQHDGQFRFWRDVTDMNPDNWVYHTEWIEYYPGHGFGPTSWAPIMGGGGGNLEQWARGGYGQPTNTEDGSGTLQDDLAVITGGNGFGYRNDDFGDMFASAAPLSLDPNGNFLATEGIIEQNTDVDYFSFVVEGLGESISFDVSPFHNGPNLDIAAKLYNSAGVELYRSNPNDGIYAGSSTLGATIDGGWFEVATGTYVSDILLLPDTYYLSVEGVGRLPTFIDPTIHPGPVDISMPPNPFIPEVHLPPDSSDWGYLDYGSLGYYSIVGTRKSLVVGVDFDAPTGTSPTNWTLYPGGAAQAVLTNLSNEAAIATPYDLTITTTAPTLQATASAAPVNSADLPTHAVPLDDVDGYIAIQDETLSFVWSDLEPGAVFQVYVFGHADTDLRNVVSVVGGEWNGEVQTYNFTQTVSAGGLGVNTYPSTGNANSPGGQALTTLSLLVVANEAGEISIDVTNEVGYVAAVAGVAIAPTRLGSIAGRKWNDANANRVQDGPVDSGDPNFEGNLGGWTVYLDLDNDGQLDSVTTQDQELVVEAPIVDPLPIGFNSPINPPLVSGLTVADVGQVESIEVTVDIDHTFPADLELVLVSPTGTRITLMNDLGGAGQLDPADDLGVLVFNDSAAQSITSIQSANAPFSGSYRPMEDLSVLAGEQSQGIWTLEIVDDANDHDGVLNGWSIKLNLAGVTVFLEPFQVTDSQGGYAFDNLLPGEYIVREHFSQQQILEGWQQTFAPPPLIVNSGANVTGWNFGNWIPTNQVGSISGQKWNDLNGDGVKDLSDTGLEDWTIYLDGNNNGQLDLVLDPLAPIASTNVGQMITDFNLVTSTLFFSGPVTSIGDINVTLDISHTFARDLTVHLTSPDGTVIELFSEIGEGKTFSGSFVLDDQAAMSIANPAVTTPISGTLRTEQQLLNLFNGENPNGVWTLSVFDGLSGDSGTLNGWSLTVSGGERFTTTDAAGNYVFENLPAGDYIVRELQQVGWEQTTLSPQGNTWWDVSIGAGSGATGRNFGNHNPSLNDDHSNSAVGATVIPTGGERIGRIGVPGDVDWFRFFANANTTYLIEVELDTLTDSVLRLIGPNGTTELELNDNAVGQGSAIRWAAPVSGTYYVEVSGATGTETGRYNVSVTAVVDDHGDDATDPTTVNDPATVAGNLETVLDVDWFSFTAVAGTEYKIQTTLGTLSDSVIRLYAADGITELEFDDNGDGLASFLRWTAPVDGTFYVEVHGGLSKLETGTYYLSIAADDHGDDSANASVAVGPGTTAGHIELSGDVDWFSFAATAGTHYHLESTLGTLGNSQLRLIGPDGTTQIISNNDYGFDTASLIQWTATASGTYYLEVSGVGGASGTYDVVITLDDHSSGAAATTPINVVSVTAGDLEVGGDEDWFSVNVVAGTTYRIETVLGTLLDSVVDIIHADGETIVASNDDAGTGFSSLIIWTAPTSGQFFIRVFGFDPDVDTGTYDLSITDGAVVGDDHANSAIGATDVPVIPGMRNGNIEIAGDVDWFKFAATADTTYLFEVHLVTLTDSVLRVIGPNGTTELAINDNALGLESVIRWTAPVAGTYYVEVKGSGTEVGTYSLSIDDPTDDHSDDPTGATSVTPPAATAGDLETLFDADWFTFDAVAGTEYKLETVLGTLTDSVLRLYDTNGITVLDSSDNAVGLESFIRWVAPVDGAYFVEVRAKDGVLIGTYDLKIAADDHGDDGVTATVVSGPGTTAGDIELPGDVDWFSFTATAGTNYLFSTTLNSLTDSQIRVIAADGTTELALNNDHGNDLASLVQWTANASGIFYIEVSDIGAVSGTYDLVITVDDHGGAAAAATSGGVGTTAGMIEVAGDEDWFSFNAVAGTTYRIGTTLGTMTDSVLQLIHPDGQTVVVSDNDSGPGSASLLFWTASSSATYYVRVFGFDPDVEVGTYDVSIASTTTLVGDYNRDGYVDSGDYVVWRRTSGMNVPVGSGADGNLDGVIGPDDFALWKAHFGSYADDHANSSAGASTAAAPGTTLGKLEASGDVDWFSFTATQGTTYFLEVELGTLSDSFLRLIGPNGTAELAANDNALGNESVIRWTAPADGVYFAEVKGVGTAVGTYGLKISLPTDDHGDESPVASLITPPIEVPSEIETLFDSDWFAFNATGGTDYRIFTTLGTLPDSVLRIYSQDGIIVIDSNDDYQGLASYLRWTAPMNGLFFIEVEGKNGLVTGTYGLSIHADDHGDDSTESSTIAVPGMQAGEIELPSDVDSFSFTATAGTDYLFDVLAGTLTDPRLRLIGPDGTTEILVSDNHGSDLLPLIQWTPTVSGTYYLEVSAAPATSGTYDLRITLDTHGADPASATVMFPPAASQGNINVPGDEDWFAFDVVQGNTYRIATSLNTLPDSELFLIHSDGLTIVDHNDNDGPGPQSAIIWTANATGRYYAKVVGKNLDADVGTYNFSVIFVLPGSGAGEGGASSTFGETAGSSQSDEQTVVASDSQPVAFPTVSFAASSPTQVTTESTAGQSELARTVRVDSLAANSRLTARPRAILARRVGELASHASRIDSLMAWLSSSSERARGSEPGLGGRIGNGEDSLSSQKGHENNDDLDAVFDLIGAGAGFGRRAI